MPKPNDAHLNTLSKTTQQHERATQLTWYEGSNSNKLSPRNISQINHSPPVLYIIRV